MTERTRQPSDKITPNISGDAPVRLSVAAQLAFPRWFDDSIWAASRRLLAADCMIERIAGKDFTTLDIDQENEGTMPRPSKGARLFKRQARATVTASSSPRPSGSSRTATDISPRDALRARLEQSRLEKRSKHSRTTSHASTNPSERRRDIEDIDCADVLSIYLTDIGEPGEQHRD